MRGSACATEMCIMGVWVSLDSLRSCWSIFLAFCVSIFLFCVFTIYWYIFRANRLYYFGVFLFVVCCRYSICLLGLCVYVWIVTSSVSIGYEAGISHFWDLVEGGLPLLLRCEMRCILGLLCCFVLYFFFSYIPSML